jgi:predicted PurR-regulated permease PerM
LLWCYFGGGIIAVSVYTPYTRLVKLFHGRKIAASAIVTIVMLSAIIIPSWLVANSMITGVFHFRDTYNQGQPIIPAPGESVQNWPAITKHLIQFWQHASDNLQEVLLQYKVQLLEVGGWLLPALSSFGKAVSQFLVSILIAAVFLVLSEPLSKSILNILNKFTSSKGEEFTILTVATIRSVVKGILGVSALQAAMAGIAFKLAWIPFAGLWTVLCLMLSIIQIGSWPILISLTIYMFMVSDTLTAVLFAGWMVVVSVTYTFLTPILMGRGSTVPMIVIFLGAMGGFISLGFLGLFLGAIILSIGYNFFGVWLNTEAQNSTI